VEGLELIAASEATSPGFLSLQHNTNETGYAFSGLAYLDADINCNVNGAPKLTSSFRAAGSWTVPVGSP
jgi:hypothetical protein